MGRTSQGKSTEAHKRAARRWYARNRETARAAALARYHAKILAYPDTDEPVPAVPLDTSRFRGVNRWRALALTLENNA